MAKKKTKKKTAKKTAKRSASKKAASSASSPKPTAITASSTTRSKSEVYRMLAEHSGASRKQVAAMFDTMKEMMAKDLSKRGPGVFAVPGLMKVTVKRMPATKARPGINPFTGEKTVFKAKPARNVVKVRPLKALKDLV
ncbi:MAG: HU family DNA-binding protein [Phycisphaerales bacterium]